MSARRPDPEAIADLPLGEQIAAIEQAMSKRDATAAEGIWERAAMGSLAGFAVLIFPLPWAQRFALAGAVGVLAARAWMKGSWRGAEMDEQNACVAAMVAYISDPTALPWLLEHADASPPIIRDAILSRVARTRGERRSAEDVRWLMDHAADLPAASIQAASVVRTRRKAGDFEWLLDHAQHPAPSVRAAAWETAAEVAPTADRAILDQVPRAKLDFIAAELVRLAEAMLLGTEEDQQLAAALIDLLADADHVPAIPALEELTRSWRPETLRSAAQAAVAHLREVAEMRKRTDHLLRPANAPGETLLRAAEPVADETLLRPAEGDGAL